MLLFIEIVLKSEIRFSDSLCRDICIVRELPAERVPGLKTGPKIKAADALSRPEKGRSRGLEPGFLVPISEIRRLLWNALPGIGSFQRPSYFFRPDRPPFCPTGQRARVRVPGDSYLRPQTAKVV